MNIFKNCTCRGANYKGGQLETWFDIGQEFVQTLSWAKSFLKKRSIEVVTIEQNTFKFLPKPKLNILLNKRVIGSLDLSTVSQCLAQ